LSAGDATEFAFIDALSIVPIGNKVGEWPVRLLAHPGWELASQVALLSQRRALVHGGLPTEDAGNTVSKIDPAAVARDRCLLTLRSEFLLVLLTGRQGALTMCRLPAQTTGSSRRMFYEIEVKNRGREHGVSGTRATTFWPHRQAATVQHLEQ
jgi:hypothetical protein